MGKEKRIEVVTMRVGDIKTEFGNPRKITNKKKEELLESLETFGDFGLIVIDENDNVIAGNQRVSVLKEKDENIEVTCKRLVGYTKRELKAINIKDNTHAGEWDLDALADWTADLSLDVDFDEKKKEDDRKIPEMELIHYEKYNYVMIVCNNELDYNNLVRALGIEGAKVKISKRKIKARAVWYHKMKAKVVPYDELPEYMLDDSDIKEKGE
ncbi:MAG TPA: hypothetical protein DHV37_06045 [Erysipelotrichaceae bacterium]|nr:hypothetical protein [Erysipelotrichaceae bacterium]